MLGQEMSVEKCVLATPGRRTLLAAGVGLAARAAGAQSDPTRERPRAGDLLVKADSTEPTPLTPDSLSPGAGQVMAWPMDPAGNIVRSGSRLNKVLMVRLDPAVLEPQTRGRAADGVVAYSAICPHTGCEVVNWFADRQILECPCHNSQYDPKAGARVIAGPSPRGLAALPLGLADGKLVVARPFIGRLGIQQL
jgi:Rieske Fe-S protein